MAAHSPSRSGSLAEMEVASALHRAGWEVFVPVFAAHSRIDLVACRGGDVLRIQVKSARRVGGVVVFKTCSNTANRPVDYRGEIDAFGVYAPELDRVFVVPVSDVGIRGASLRIDSVRNGQSRGVRWADDYAVPGSDSGHAAESDQSTLGTSAQRRSRS